MSKNLISNRAKDFLADTSSAFSCTNDQLHTSQILFVLFNVRIIYRIEKVIINCWINNTNSCYNKFIRNCNRTYKLKRCSNKECCKQCRYVMFKGTMTKWLVQKLAQGTTQKLLQHHDATDI